MSRARILFSNLIQDLHNVSTLEIVDNFAADGRPHMICKALFICCGRAQVLAGNIDVEEPIEHVIDAMLCSRRRSLELGRRIVVGGNLAA